MPTEPPPSKGPSQSGLRLILIKSSVVLVLAVVALAVFACVPDLKKSFFDPDGPLARWLRGLNGYGIVVFSTASAVLILIGVPRLLLCVIAGALYGFWIGLVASLVSSVISYYAAFAWIRGRRHQGLEKSVLPKQLAFLAGNPGLMGVMISRVVPAPGMLITLALALSNVSLGAYLLGSAIGLIPEAIPAVLLGSMGKDFTRWGKMAGLVVIGIFILWFFIHQTTRRLARAKIEASEKSPVK